MNLVIVVLIYLSVVWKWRDYGFLGWDFLLYGFKRSFTGFHEKILRVILLFNAATTLIEIYYSPHQNIGESIGIFIINFISLVILNSCYSFWLYDVDEFIEKYICSILSDKNNLKSIENIYYSNEEVTISDYTIKNLKENIKNDYDNEENFSFFVNALRNNFIRLIKENEFNKEHIDFLNRIVSGEHDKTIKISCVNFIESNLYN